MVLPQVVKIKPNPKVPDFILIKRKLVDFVQPKKKVKVNASHGRVDQALKLNKMIEEADNDMVKGTSIERESKLMMRQ